MFFHAHSVLYPVQCGGSPRFFTFPSYLWDVLEESFWPGNTLRSGSLGEGME